MSLVEILIAVDAFIASVIGICAFVWKSQFDSIKRAQDKPICYSCKNAMCINKNKNGTYSVVCGLLIKVSPKLQKCNYYEEEGRKQ